MCIARPTPEQDQHNKIVTNGFEPEARENKTKRLITLRMRDKFFCFIPPSLRGKFKLFNISKLANS